VGVIMDIIMILSFKDMVTKCPQTFSLIALLNNVLFTEVRRRFLHHSKHSCQVWRCENLRSCM